MLNNDMHFYTQLHFPAQLDNFNNLMLLCFDYDVGVI